MSYSSRRKRAASERGKRMAARRWELDRARRECLAKIDPVQFAGKITARNIFIDERTGKMTETVFYDFDSEREWRRKLRKIRLPMRK